jgi:hypothetical protein
MTTQPNNPVPTPEPDEGAPLEPWMLELATEAVNDLDADVEVPSAMMWKRIDAKRREQGTGATEPLAIGGRAIAQRSWRMRQVAAIAAVLVGGVAIGRYIVPAASVVPATAETVAANPIDASANDPSRVAMQEHLSHTVALLAAVNDGGASHAVTKDIGSQARDLLTTTRLLLDQPQLRDSTTRRLLQDLELVLVQVIQARGSAPETQRAPQETLKETNLLTRVRALVTASSATDGPTYGGN